MLFLWMSLKTSSFGKKSTLNSLPNDKIWGSSKLKALADNKLNATKKVKLVLG